MGSLGDPFFKRTIRDKLVFNRGDLCPHGLHDKYENGEPLQFMPIYSEYRDLAHPFLSRSVCRSGYITQVCILPNGSKIGVILHSPGINKVWVILNDPNIPVEDAYLVIKDYCRQVLGIYLEYYKERYGSIKNKGDAENYIRPGLELFFKSGSDLFRFYGSIECIPNLKLHYMTAPIRSKQIRYFMSIFSIAEGMWYRAVNWEIMPAEHQVTTLDIEIMVRLIDVQQLMEVEQLSMRGNMIVLSLDIEARIDDDGLNEPINMFKRYDALLSKQVINNIGGECISDGDFAQMAANGENVITNVCIYLARQGIPNTYEIFQGINLCMIDKSVDIDEGFEGADGLWVQNVKVDNLRELAEAFAGIINVVKPDFLCGHNSYRFDVPALASLIDLFKGEVLAQLLSCIKIKDDRGYEDVISHTREDVYKITQALAFYVPSINMPGVILMDTMHISIKMHDTNSQFLPLNEAAERLGIAKKHSMSYSLMDKINDVICRKIFDNQLPLDEVTKQLGVIYTCASNEHNLGGIDDNVWSDIKYLYSKYLDKTLDDAKTLFVALVTKTWEYCANDTIIVAKIMGTTSPMFDIFGQCRATCLMTKDVMKTGVFSLINSLFDYTTCLRDGMYSKNDNAIPSKSDPAFRKVFGATMFINKGTTLANYKLCVTFDFTSAYPNAMKGAITPGSIRFVAPTGDEPGTYIKIFIPSDDLTKIKVVYYRLGELTELGQLADRLLELRAQYKVKMNTTKDNVIRIQSSVMEKAYKTLANSIYGVLAMKKEDKFYQPTANSIVMETGYELTRIVLALIGGGHISSGMDIVHAHTDSVTFRPDLATMLDKEVPIYDCAAYRNFIRDNHVEIMDNVYKMTDYVNNCLNEAHFGKSTFQVKMEWAVSPSIYSAQLKYVVCDVTKGVPDTITDYKIKGLLVKSRTCTPMVKTLVHSIILSMLNAMVAGYTGIESDEYLESISLNKCENELRLVESKGEMKDIITEAVNKCIVGVDTENLKQFTMSMKYKTKVNNVKVKKIINEYNSMIHTNQIVGHEIISNCQIRALNILTKRKWRLNGLHHTAKTRGRFIMYELFNKDLHEINLAYYFKAIRTDVVTLASSFGYETKDMEKHLTSLLTLGAPNSANKTNIFVAWYPVLALMIRPDGKDFTGLAKYISYETSNLDRFIIKYINRLEAEVLKNINMIEVGEIDQRSISGSLLRSQNALTAMAIELDASFCSQAVVIGTKHINSIYNTKPDISNFMNDMRIIVNKYRRQIDDLNTYARTVCLLRLQMKISLMSVNDKAITDLIEQNKNIV